MGWRRINLVDRRSGTPDHLVAWVFHSIVPLHGLGSAGACRAILGDRRRPRPDALCPRMMLRVALRIASKAGSPPGAPIAPSPVPPISTIPIRSIRACQSQNVVIAIPLDSEVHLECAKPCDQDARRGFLADPP